MRPATMQNKSCPLIIYLDLNSKPVSQLTDKDDRFKVQLLFRFDFRFATFLMPGPTHKHTGQKSKVRVP